MGTQSSEPGAQRSRVVAALLPRFIANRRKDVTTIRDCTERREFPTIVRIGHNMQGNGASYGFPELCDLGKDLEAAAVREDEGRVRELLDSLVAWLDALGPAGSC
jgi:hypothetical protein